MIFVTDEVKQNPEKRWSLPDEVFFAAGACHILAYAFLEKYPDKGFTPYWIKPGTGHRGNHIFVTDHNTIFDYKGFQKFDNYIEDLEVEMKSMFFEWNYKLVELPKTALISEIESKKIDRLHLRSSEQFLYNALPRARKYLDSFDQDRVLAHTRKRRIEKRIVNKD
jgi:hypothetical protein